MTEQLHFHFSLSCIGEGNGNPLQCSCLENPRDSGAWWAAVYGVAQSLTRLKRFSSSSNRSVFSYKMLIAWLWESRQTGTCPSYVTRTQEIGGCWPWSSALRCGSWYRCLSLCPSFRTSGFLLRFLLWVPVESRKKGGFIYLLIWLNKA